MVEVGRCDRKWLVPVVKFIGKRLSSSSRTTDNPQETFVTTSTAIDKYQSFALERKKGCDKICLLSPLAQNSCATEAELSRRSNFSNHFVPLRTQTHPLSSDHSDVLLLKSGTQYPNSSFSIRVHRWHNSSCGLCTSSILPTCLRLRIISSISSSGVDLEELRLPGGLQSSCRGNRLPSPSSRARDWEEPV